MLLWTAQLNEKPKWTDVAIVILTAGIVFFAFVQWREMVGAGCKQTNLLTQQINRLKPLTKFVTPPTNKLKPLGFRYQR
jgi:hypothetical protein